MRLAPSRPTEPVRHWRAGLYCFVVTLGPERHWLGTVESIRGTQARVRFGADDVRSYPTEQLRHTT